MGRDIIAEILTYIRNADKDKKIRVKIAATNLSRNVVKILLQEGFIENIRKHNESRKNYFVLILRHRRNPNKMILKRISRPGLRIYSSYKKIPKILGGMGAVVLSTSQGMMTDREARIEKIGGEILYYIW
uniref:Small ribosomal subunit protein uS8c n=1 Tax=Lecanorchis japonica TaxID=915449 RepID=A0A6G7KVM6_9ASPA|nr:ribosomal protein S8 [Lecanorchis japonica]QII89417.1 ribosomal protein S8 [Lecanorchis japonica]